MTLRVLRHSPRDFGPNMDQDGWVPVSQLVAVLANYGIDPISIPIAKFMRPLEQRVQLRAVMVRASYGHSCPEYQPGPPSIPDQPLFHGTTSECWPMIELFGLQPVRRRFVQLTTDVHYTTQIAHALESTPIVLQISTATAIEENAEFFATDTHVWLASHVPSVFLQFRHASAPETDTQSNDLDYDDRMAP
ncbi:MAG: RNA 2'-phosphotransferase [Planctomycetales bacterium]|nr:RNA 2'-phosphotransferase [Planctomycetales bacterium]